MSSPRLLVLLTGPGFCVTDELHSFLLDRGSCRTSTISSAFENAYPLLQSSGGFPKGDYQLDFFLYGRKLYTMRFALS